MNRRRTLPSAQDDQGQFAELFAVSSYSFTSFELRSVVNIAGK
jgi:hypothetical protein